MSLFIRKGAFMTLNLFFKIIVCLTAGAVLCIADRGKSDERWIFLKCILLSGAGALGYNFGPPVRDIYFKDATLSCEIPVLAIGLFFLLLALKGRNIALKRKAALVGILAYALITFAFPAAQRLVMGDYYLLQNATSGFFQVFRVHENNPQNPAQSTTAPIGFSVPEDELIDALVLVAAIDNHWDVSNEEAIAESLERARYAAALYPADSGFECVLDLPRLNMTYVAVFLPDGGGTYTMRYAVCGVLEGPKRSGSFIRSYLT